MRLRLGLTLLFAGPVLAAAQAPPRFAVVSIRPSVQGTWNSPGAQPPGFVCKDKVLEFDPVHLSSACIGLPALIYEAYALSPYQIAGMPQWAQDARYSLQAGADHPFSRREAMVALQAVLREHFALALSPQVVTRTAYVLTIASGGSKLKAAANDAAPPSALPASGNGFQASATTTRGTVTMRFGSVTELVKFLNTVYQSDRAGRPPVIDKTGLSADYDIEVALPRRPAGGMVLDPGEVDYPKLLLSTLGLEMTTESAAEVTIFQVAASPPQ